MDLRKLEPTVEHLLVLLHSALIDMREASDLEHVHRLTEILHDLPAHLLKNPDESDLELALKQIIERSQFYGMEDYIHDLLVDYSNEPHLTE